ncbi:MAG: STAS domain-containing protein [candidate division Zixibacteria bacterium]|nr:STAS domain-containing protein [candidate division Zixibacteria bacterium]
MENNINISLLERDGDEISGVRIDGVIDTITASELERVVESLIKRHRYKIILDLAGVDYISSAGWGIFISHIKEVRANEGDIKLVNMIDNVFEIYELLEFENVLRSYNTYDEARSDFGQIPIDGSVKKKAQKNARVTVVDRLAGNSNNSSIASTGFSSNPTDPVSFVLKNIKDDPFVTISEVKSLFNKSNSSADKIGWWEIFGILKRQKLLSRRSRFRFARQFFRS